MHGIKYILLILLSCGSQLATGLEPEGEKVFLLDPSRATTTNENVHVWIRDDRITVKAIEKDGMKIVYVSLNIHNEDGSWLAGAQLSKVVADWDKKQDYYVFNLHPRLQRRSFLNISFEDDSQEDWVVRFRTRGGKEQSSPETEPKRKE